MCFWLISVGVEPGRELGWKSEERCGLLNLARNPNYLEPDEAGLKGKSANGWRRARPRNQTKSPESKNNFSGQVNFVRANNHKPRRATLPCAINLRGPFLKARTTESRDIFFFLKMYAGGNLFFGAENSWRCLMVPDYADVTGLAVRITMVHPTQLWLQMRYMEMYNSELLKNIYARVFTFKNV